uniref:TRASH domain-containing protein n=1 Tax=Periophthalmus magnuspinnatus TaxID=409849 RepID=A0A3B4B6C8_9GOBI
MKLLCASVQEVDHSEENGLYISNAFSLDLDSCSARLGPQGEPVHNGDSGPNRTGHSAVTCANCKKPLKKGQTAYQRKGSTHLFCSTTCLSAFSHKPAPKKSCTMCKKDITNMKGTIVAQVDSSESFQEFCSTGCLGAYENKQNPPKSGVKTKCTVCGKLTEIRHEVSFKTVTHRICSDTCFNVYRRANGLIMNCCEQCGDYLPSRTSANHFLLVDGQQKRFCCHNCIRDFKQVCLFPKYTSYCVTCKTLIKTGEVLHSIVANGTMGSYCSITCMNKGKTSPTSLQSEFVLRPQPEYHCSPLLPSQCPFSSQCFFFFFYTMAHEACPLIRSLFPVFQLICVRFWLAKRLKWEREKIWASAGFCNQSLKSHMQLFKASSADLCTLIERKKSFEIGFT